MVKKHLKLLLEQELYLQPTIQLVVDILQNNLQLHLLLHRVLPVYKVFKEPEVFKEHQSKVKRVMLKVFRVFKVLKVLKELQSKDKQVTLKV